ncbi:unnamed protein product, partial [Mesorhabditis belari]|uniref:Origin recognition complex subunit 3 n=1 Tax=Mesorhabditis belari TaxID=2138241 RepID=A0AAF3ER32_9BILA
MSSQRNGIHFNPGKQKKLEVDLSLIPGSAEHIKIMERMLKDIDSCVDGHLNKIFLGQVKEIAKFLLLKEIDDSERDRKMANLFDPNSEQAIYQAAIVTCNFADTAHVVEMCREELLGTNQCIMMIDHQSPADIIAKILEQKITTNCVLVIRQAETLPITLLTQLLNLLHAMPINAMVSFLICVSTTPAFLVSTCSLRALRQLEAKIFHLETSDECNKELITKLLNLKDKQPADEPPMQLSGQLVFDAFERYTIEHKSIILLKNSLKFAIARHFLEKVENPAQTTNFRNFVEKYQKVCQLFAKLNGVIEGKVHADVQLYGENYLTNDELSYNRKWKHSLLSASDQELKVVVDHVKELLNQLKEDETATAMEELCARLDERLTIPSPPKRALAKENTPQKPRRSTFMQLRQLNEDRLKEKASNPLVVTRQELCSLINDFFKENLIAWDQEASASYSVMTAGKETITASGNMRKDIERTLSLKNNVISASLQVLLSGDVGWKKNILFGEWLRIVKREFKGFDDQVSPTTTLYATAAHLEHIGILKNGVEKQFPSVSLNYFPFY